MCMDNESLYQSVQSRAVSMDRNAGVDLGGGGEVTRRSKRVYMPLCAS